WYRRRDSNPHCLVSKTSASFRLGYTGMKNFGFRNSNFGLVCPAKVNSQSEIRNPNFFWWTWHDLNVRPRPSHGRALFPLSYRSEKDFEFGIAEGEFRLDLQFRNPKSAIRNAKS